MHHLATVVLLFLATLCFSQQADAVGFWLAQKQTRCFGEEISDGAVVHGVVTLPDEPKPQPTYHLRPGVNRSRAEEGSKDSNADIDTLLQQQQQQQLQQKILSPLQLHFQILSARDTVLYDAPDASSLVQYSFMTQSTPLSNDGAPLDGGNSPPGSQEYRFCFTDRVREGAAAPPTAGTSRRVTFTVDTREEKDWSAIAKKEHLDPLELKLRQIQDDVRLLSETFTKMKLREKVHRNTNESTNSRVAWISGMSLVTLSFLGVVQMSYLRQFFKSKRLI